MSAAEPGTTTGTTGDWWTVFANSPEILDHCVKGFGLYQSPTRTLEPKLRELGQIRAGWAAGSQFVYSQHAKSMRELEMPEEQIAHIPAWSVAPAGTYGEAERAVLELAAVVEPLGQAELERLADPRSVETLERKGLITSLADGRRVQLRLAHPVVGDVVRAGLSALRERAAAGSWLPGDAVLDLGAAMVLEWHDVVDLEELVVCAALDPTCWVAGLERPADLHGDRPLRR